MKDAIVLIVRQAIFTVLDERAWNFEDDEQRVDFADRVLTFLPSPTRAWLTDEQIASVGAAVPAGRGYTERRDRAIADASAAFARPDLKQSPSAEAVASRGEIIEECAKVADKWFYAVAAAIRALKNAAPQGSAGTHRTDPAGPVSDDAHAPAVAAPSLLREHVLGPRTLPSPTAAFSDRDRQQIGTADALIGESYEFMTHEIEAGRCHSPLFSMAHRLRHSLRDLYAIVTRAPSTEAGIEPRREATSSDVLDMTLPKLQDLYDRLHTASGQIAYLQGYVRELQSKLTQQPSSTGALSDWLREHAPDCGDNSCLFGGRGKGGMRTNGGCRCFKDLPTAKRIYVERLFAALNAVPSATAVASTDLLERHAVIEMLCRVRDSFGGQGGWAGAQQCVMAIRTMPSTSTRATQE